MLPKLSVTGTPVPILNVMLPLPSVPKMTNPGVKVTTLTSPAAPVPSVQIIKPPVSTIVPYTTTTSSIARPSGVMPVNSTIPKLIIPPVTTYTTPKISVPITHIRTS